MLARFLLLLILLSPLAQAAGPSRNSIPEPELLPTNDSYSIAVVKLRQDDAAIQELLKAALESIRSGETKLPKDMAEVQDYLSRGDRAKMLAEGLPFQGVRVDRLLDSGHTSPTYAFTLAGWRGLQRVVYNSLAANSEGDAFPSETYAETELLKRSHHADPTWADNFANVDGTFLFAPSGARAKTLIDRMTQGGTAEEGELQKAYQQLAKSTDAYGVLVNRAQAFSTLLKDFDNEHINKVRDAVGSERLDRVVDSVTKATWKVDIVSSERAEFEALLELDPKDVAEAVAAFEEGQKSLDKESIADFKLSSTDKTVTVKMAMIGLKKVMLDGMTSFGKSQS